jgi:hypothetical protein
MLAVHHCQVGDKQELIYKWCFIILGIATCTVQVEAAYKTEIINIAEYLNTKYKGDQFVNIFRNHESTQPNMNSIFKLAEKFSLFMFLVGDCYVLQSVQPKLAQIFYSPWKPIRVLVTRECLRVSALISKT